MYEVNPDFNSFKRNYLKRKNQLFWKVFKSDLDTPVSAYLKLCENSNKKNCFLLESVQDGSYRGRYSIIGMLPDIVWKSIQNQVFLKKVYKKNNYIKVDKKPLLSLKFLASIFPPSFISVPRPAMFVAIVMAFTFPASAIIFASSS